MDEETKKVIANLCSSINAMQAEIETLKNGATYSGDNLAGSQNSDIEPGNNAPPNERRKTVSEVTDNHSGDEEEDEPFVDLRANGGSGRSKLVEMSEEVAAFIETAFKSKLKNSERVKRAEKYGVPDSRWLKFPELDPVVAATIPTISQRADRAASRLQNFWLDTVNPLVYVLERAEELELPAEVIAAIQTSLQLLGNASAQNTTDRRKAILTQLNSRLKSLVRDADFKEAAPLLFGDNFATLAKERLETAAALTKTLNIDKQPRWDFQKSHPQKFKGCGGGSHYNSGHYKQRGWQPSSSKSAMKQKK